MKKDSGTMFPNKAGGRRQWKKAGEDRMRVKVNGRDDGEREREKKKNMWIRECRTRELQDQQQETHDKG